MAGFFVVLAALIIGAAVVVLVRSRKQVVPVIESPPMPALAHTEPSSVAVVSPPTAIVLGDAEAPQLSLRLPQDIELARKRETFALPKSTKSALAPLLEQAPRALGAAADLASSATKVIITFSPETTRALASGGAELVRAAGSEGAFRTIARGADGKFIEHGKLLAKVNPAAVAMAAWQVAAIITAQHFLDEINAKLAGIEERLDGLRAYLEKTIRADVFSAVSYMRDHARALAAGDLDPRELQAVINELERIDRLGRQVCHLTLAEMKVPTDALRDRKLDGWVGVDKEVATAGRDVAAMGTASEMLLGGAQVRLLALGLRGALGLSQTYTNDALRSVASDLVQHERAWAEFDGVLSAKLPELKATFQRAKTDEKRQQEVRQALRDASLPRLAAAEGCRELVAKFVGEVARRQDAQQESIELELTVTREGEVLRAERLLA